MTDHAAAARLREDRTIARALRIIERRQALPGQSFYPTHAKEYFRLRLDGLDREVFDVAFLNCHHQLIACERMFLGGLTHADIDHREVARQSLLNNAAAVVVAHNHPSGMLVPSGQDYRLTEALRKTLAVVGVDLLDHILVAGGQAECFGTDEQVQRYFWEQSTAMRRSRKRMDAAQKGAETRRLNREAAKAAEVGLAV